MTRIELGQSDRICQGDIFGDIDFVEAAVEREGIIAVSKIGFPMVVVLTQDCDLEGDYLRRKDETSTHSKFILSTIVAPVYNFEHFILGEHLSELQIRMQDFKRNSTPYKYIVTNQNPRFHYLEFPSDVRIIKKAVIDFKHYFTVTVRYLESIKQTNFLCRVQPLYREDISQRFAAFLSRIGLPTIP